MSNSTPMPARNEFFKLLKPCCVAISKIALRPDGGAIESTRLTGLITELYDIISLQVQRDPSVFDEKLADYVFFPLSHVFRNQAQHSPRLIEVSLKCLTSLILHGWKAKISPEVVQQLLILLTFISGGLPDQQSKPDIPEETVLEATRALTALLTVSGSSALASASLVDGKNIPALGHAVTVTLESVKDGTTPEIQAEALRGLQAVFTSIKDHAALATFLPGVVSSLTQLLSMPARQKTRVLAASIRTLKVVLIASLADLRTRAILAKMKSSETSDDGDDESRKILSASWLKATVSQIKLALATVLKLRTNGSSDVSEALLQLCLSLLDECHTTLENCRAILVESSIMLQTTDGAHSTFTTGLQDLAIIYPELGEVIKVTIYNWITSLPRIMQSADEGVKQSVIASLLKGMDLATRLQLDSSTLNDAVSSALRDSVSHLVAETGSSQIISTTSTFDQDSLSSRELVGSDRLLSSYQHVVMGQESQGKTRTDLLSLVSKVGSTSQQLSLSLEMLDNSRDLSGAPQVASFWLSFELVKAVFARSCDTDEFLDLSSVTTASEDPEGALHEVYSFAVTTLDAHSESAETDWRLEAISLEVAAFAASRSRKAFRPELIDVLYPVATFLGSHNPLLREHAITTLNVIASSCEYRSVSELIIDNADYMVNSISLRFNIFDITPASTKVLIMMTRLTGPRLVPYLDDVVASVFAALENYHGYAAFVGSLFAVLKEIVDQGVKSERLLLEGRQNGPQSHRKRRKADPTKMDDILTLIDKREARRNQITREEGLIDANEAEAEDHPKRAWRSSKYKATGAGQFGLDESDGDHDDDNQNTEVEKEKPPKTPTYTLLEKIADLAQHYLTSPSPNLRKLLLDLLSSVSPALSADEDAFLPLINAVWPVVISRLYDSEAFVTIAACDTLCALCATAGDFLTTRLKTEWWGGLGKWCRKKKLEAGVSQTQAKGRIQPKGSYKDGTSSSLVGNVAPLQKVLVPTRTGVGSLDMSLSPSFSTPSDEFTISGSGGGLGQFASSFQIWEATVRLLVALVSYVRIEDQIFEEILALLADRLPRDREAREALEVVNPDAVWFALYEAGTVEVLSAPVLDGAVFPAMERKVIDRR